MEDKIIVPNALEKLKADLSIPTEEKEIPIVASFQAPTTDGLTDEIEDEPIGLPSQKLLTPELLQSEVSLAIGMIDFTQHNIFRVAVKYKSKNKLKNTFGENAVERAEILKDGGVAKDSMSDEDKAILRVQKKIDEVVEGLPFSDEESKVLRPLLEKYIIANNGKLPENFFAYLGLIQIFGGRLLNVIML